MTEIEQLKAENTTLRDLLETAYRNVDKARTESDKADAEALEHKVRNLGKACEDLAGSYALVKHFERRALEAEAALASLTTPAGGIAEGGR